jgi:GNAT superfamily N-acetyltransferase
MHNLTNAETIPGLVIRGLAPGDAQVFSRAFSDLGWNKPVSQYERYLREQDSGARDVFVAEVDSIFTGYVCVEWVSKYKPFAENGVPEITDLNVLPSFRRRGIGNALLGAAEAKIAERSDVAGIGVGMTPDYGQAQRMYPQRGYIPDGRGLTQNREVVKFREPIVVDDSTVLWFTKNLRKQFSGS